MIEHTPPYYTVICDECLTEIRYYYNSRDTLLLILRSTDWLISFFHGEQRHTCPGCVERMDRGSLK